MQLTKIPGQVVESALSLVGIRVGTEEPHYLKRSLTANVEIRQYGPRVAAETVVDAEEEPARNIGFRRLARYIFGGNQRGESISMTAPVAQPRSQGGQSTIRFFMPAKWTLETLPQPNDDVVQLVTVHGETVAVLKFTGDRSPSAVAEHEQRLRKTLRDNGIDPEGDAVAWFYDPPWTLPFLRRNEVAIPVHA